MSSRVGNFSSSEIHKLMSRGRGNRSLENTGAPFYTYIQEKVYERKLGRPLSQKQNSRITTWGSFVEKQVFDLLGLEYQLISKDRYVHPDIDCWTGMPDIVTRDKKIVGDIKCPWTLKSFCEMIGYMEQGSEALKAKKPEYYWQLVSSSILTGIDEAELIVYVPYFEELENIKELANNHSWDGHLSENDVAFINYASNEELPYLKKGGYYKNLNAFHWVVDPADKALLTARVKMAQELLIKQTEK